MSNVFQKDDVLIFHPGYYIEELLEEYSLEELSQKTGLSENRLTDLIQAKVGLNVKDACSLSNGLGMSTTFWINLQKTYDQVMKMEENEYE